MTAIWPAVPTTPTAGAPPRPAGAAARGVPDTGARRGSALTLAVLGMATVSFNMTRVGGWTISDLFFLASGAIVVIKLLNNDQRFLTPKRYRSGSQVAIAGILLIVTGATLSSFGSWSPLASMMVVARFIWSSLVWFWILRAVCPDRIAFQILMKAWRFTILASSLVALLGEYAGVRFNSGDFGQDRQAGLTFHPGELMNFLIAGFFMFLIPAFIPSARSTRRFATLWWLAGTGVVTLAIFSTGSTSALLAIGLGTIVVFCTSVYAGRSGLGKRRSPLVSLSIVAVAVAGASLLMSSDLPIAERLTSYGEGSGNLDDSIGSRNEVNDAILGDFDKYLLVGVGPTFFGGAADSLVDAQHPGENDYGNIHNMYLKMLYESGFPALVGLWIIIYAIGRQAFRLVVVNRGTDLYASSLVLLGAFVAVNTSSMFGPTAYARHFWLPFAMIGCLWAVRRRELDEAASTRRDAVTDPQVTALRGLPARRPVPPG